MSLVPADTAETRRIATHLQNLHRLIAETKASHLALKGEIAATPEAMVTAAQKAELARLEREVLRLQNGFNYWQRKLETARRNAGLPPALQDPQAGETLDRIWTLRSPDPPPEVPLIGPVPLPPAPPLPPQIGLLASQGEAERVCGMPPGLNEAARQRWINSNVAEAWDLYQRDRERAEEDYYNEVRRWHVALTFWKMRRAKAEAAGLALTERAPERPDFAPPTPPRCRPGPDAI